jgi:hypothetical protein
MNIDSIDNVHPYWRIWYHPLWKEALEQSFLPDYDDSPFYTTETKPTANTNVTSTGLHHYSTNESNEEASTRRFNAEIFEQLGDFGHLNISKRVSMLREHYNILETYACKTGRGHKYAMAAVIEATNRLKSMKLNENNSIIHCSALDSALTRHGKDSLENQSALKYTKLTNTSNGSGRKRSTKKSAHCSVCRRFNMPENISSTHRANSSKCPHHVAAISTAIQHSQVGVAQSPLIASPVAQPQMTVVCSYGKDCKGHGVSEVCSHCNNHIVHRLCVPNPIEQLWCMSCIINMANNSGVSRSRTASDGGRSSKRRKL